MNDPRAYDAWMEWLREQVDRYGEPEREPDWDDDEERRLKPDA